MSAPRAGYDIAVVGCGPVGAFAATMFGKAGLRTIVIEKLPEPYPLPRAVHIDHEMMRLFQAIGLADHLLPLMREAHGHIHIGADGGVIRYLGSAGLPKRFGWANDYFFYQPELEAELRRAAARFPDVKMRTGVELVAIDNSDAGAQLTIAAQDGARSQIAARYVVACDGASSFVRKSLGIKLNDMQFDEPWLVVDAELETPMKFPAFSGVPGEADLHNLSVMLCDPRRPATLVPGRGKHRRWEFMLLPGENEQTMMQPEQVAALLQPYLAGVPHRLIRAATYRFHGLLAERWQAGRVFLAGDAAHQTPPFFGQGMCHGFRDVANLSWKFERVLKHGADAALLDSYQPEREPHVRAVVEAAIGAGRYICERDPEKARKRDENLREQMGKPAPKSASDLIPPLTAGVIDSDKRAGVGARFVQPFVERGGQRQLLDDATGGGFVLLAPDALLAELPGDARQAWAKIGGKSFAIGGGGDDAIADSDGGLAAWFTQHDAAAVILRPDFYVYGTAKDGTELTRMTKQLATLLSPRAA